jgi:signal transduction histidine kinase/DNA-binding response OmpR family regulator
MATVLIVDDDPVNRAFLMTLLGSRGHRLVQAADGAEGLVVARAERPDLVITDILMPTMDGYEFVRRLHADPVCAHIPIVFWSARYLEREARTLAQACNVSHILTKPCEPAEVLRTVDAALSYVPALTTAPPEDFDREHLRVVSDKLAEKVAELSTVNLKLGALVETGRRLALERDPLRLLDDYCRAARDIIGVQWVAGGMLHTDEHTLHHFSTSGLAPEMAISLGTPQFNQGVFSALLHERSARRLHGLAGDPQTLGFPPGYPSIYSFLGVPIASPIRVYGCLALANKLGADAFDKEDERLAKTLAAQLAVAYENARLYTELERRTAALEQGVAQHQLTEARLLQQLARLALLHQITHAIGERQDLRSIFLVVLRRLEQDLPLAFGCLCLGSLESDTLTVTAVSPASQVCAATVGLAEQAVLSLSQNGLQACVKGQTVSTLDTAQEHTPLLQHLARAGLRSLVATPLLVEGSIFGILLVARRDVQGFSSNEVEFLHQLSEHVALAAHQVQLYTRLQQAYDDLQQNRQLVMQQERLRALGQMASGIAHDINNALSPVALYIESVLVGEPTLSTRAQGYLTTVQQAVYDIAHTVAQLREFYRQPAGPQESHPIALNQIVQEVVELTRAKWRDEPQQRGLTIAVHTVLQEHGLPLLLGVESELREALINLVLNAVDAMPEGGILTIQTRATPTAVILEVQDTGIGMDEVTRQRCLEPFYTTKGERGTGLGLAVVYGVLERHAAQLTIESAVEHGTTMRLLFPRVPSNSTTSAQRAEVEACPPSLRILVIDDDLLLRQSLQDVLQSEGHAVTVADGGEAGLEIVRDAQARQESFAVVMTDLGMPGMDGREVARVVKHAAPETPVVLLTGWGQALQQDGSIPPHVDCLLSKPPRLRELRAALVAVTESRGRRMDHGTD